MNKKEIERIKNQSKVTVYKETHTPPDVERVTNKEVYTLDLNGNRIKRICGYMVDGWPCTRPAGSNTLHTGVGYCVSHDSYRAGEKDYLQKYINVISDESSLKEHFVRANIDTDDPFEIEELIRLTKAMMSLAIDDGQWGTSHSLQKEIRANVELIRKLVETQEKKNTNKMVASGISMFLNSVFSILYAELGKEQFDRIRLKMMDIELPEEIQNIEFEEIK